MPKTATNVEVATKQLDRVLSFFPRVESKASFLFAVDAALLGVLAVNVQKEDFSIWYAALAAISASAFFCLSLYFVYRCIFPSLAGGHASLIFFREIAKLREPEYLQAIKSVTDDQLLDDLLGQVWRNSEILGKKFDHIKIAFVLTGTGLLPWLTFLVSAALNHTQWPVIK
ncbi:hypothetical protein ACVIGB_010277 [Bradyrhizobium sp. USDA 4341]